MKLKKTCLIILVALFINSCADIKKTTVIRWAMNKELHAIGGELARAYMEDHPYITVTVVPLPSFHWKQKKAMDEFIKNKSADMFTVDNQLLEYLLDSQHISPVKRKQMRQHFQDYFKGIIPLCGTEYHMLYAFPWLVDTSALFYRDDVLTDYNILPPRTWDELASACRDIINDKKNIGGILISGGEDLLLAKLFIEALWSHGLDVITDDGHIMLDLPQVTILLKKWRRFTKKNIFSKKITSGARSQTLEEFKNGGAIFYYGALSDCQLLDDSYTSGDSSYTFAFTAIPQVLAVSADSRYKNECIKFINFLISYPSQEILLMHDWIPAMKKVFEESEAVQYKPHYTDMSALLDEAIPIPLHRITPNMLAVLQKNMASIFNNALSPAEGMYTAMNKIRDLPRMQSVRKKKKKPKQPSASKKSSPVPAVTPAKKSEPTAVPASQTITGLSEAQTPKPLTGLQEFQKPHAVTGLSESADKSTITGLAYPEKPASITELKESPAELKNSYTEPNNKKEESQP